MKSKLGRDKEIEVILTICVGLVLLFLISEKQLLAGSHKKALLGVAVILGVIGLFSKTLTAYIAAAWMKLSEVLGLIMPKVILSIVFFFFLFPVALLTRLLSKRNFLQLKKTGPSYYFSRNHKFTAKDLENTW
ncbi:MAG: SxtJ family membrane protein [Chitinophagales bacterium]